MTQEQIDALPEHLSYIKFEPYHIYVNTATVKGKQKTTITPSDNLIDDLLRWKDIGFAVEMPYIGPFRENQTLLVAKVTVWTGEYEFARNTVSFASVNAMQYEKGEKTATHLAQLAVTRALKPAVLRHLRISDHDIALLIEAYDIDIKKLSKTPTAVRTSEASEDDADDTEEKNEVPLLAETDASLNLSLEGV